MNRQERRCFTAYVLLTGLIVAFLLTVGVSAASAAEARTEQVSRMVGAEPVTFQLPASFTERNYWVFIGGRSNVFAEQVGRSVYIYKLGMVVRVGFDHRVRAQRVLGVGPLRLTIRWTNGCHAPKELCA